MHARVFIGIVFALATACGASNGDATANANADTDVPMGDARVDDGSDARSDGGVDAALDTSPACTPVGAKRFLDDAHGAFARFYFGAHFTGTPVDVVVDAASGDWSWGTPASIEIAGRDGGAFTSDHYGVRYLGALVAPVAGTYVLTVATNPAIPSDVVTLAIDGAPFTLGDSIALDPSTPRAFELDYDHTTVGQARVALQWTGPGIVSPTTIPSSALRADLRAVDLASKSFAGMADGSMPIGVFWPNESTLSSTSTKIPTEYVRSDGHTGWRERGVNVLWFDNQWGGGGDLGTLVHLAATLGFSTWRFPADRMINTGAPTDAKSFDAADTTLMAYSLEDEANGKSDWPIAHFSDEAAHARATRPIPIVDGFSGSQLAGLHSQSDIDVMRSYLSQCDWVGMDDYPLAQFSDVAVLPIPEGIDRMAHAIAKLVEWSGGKPAFAFVDTSNQRLTADARGPTAIEVDAMVWGALVAGARSISYFPEVPVAGGANDGTPPDVEAELPRLNALVQKWAPVLLDEGVTISNWILPGRFRVAIRKHAGKTYAFVFNDSSSAATWHSSHGDVLAYYGVEGPKEGESFAPYELDVESDCTTTKVTFPLP
jgi:hypothetical protein